MPTSSSSGRLSDQALATAWSLWAELGVSGWERRHPFEAVDLEPLVLSTSWLGRLDHRLLDESLDWCVANARFASATRFRGLLKQADPEVVELFGQYSATVTSKAPKIRWPGEGKPRRISPSGKSQVPQLERPALLQLRLRAVFGVAARAEVLRLLLIDAPHGWSAAELAVESGYAKVNVAAALELLAMAGLVRTERVGTQFRYRLAKAPQLRELAGPLPTFQPDWPARFGVMRHLVQLELDSADAGGDVLAANIVATLRQIHGPIARLGLADVLPAPGRPDFVEEFARWSQLLLACWAGESPTAAAGDVIYRVVRLDQKWKATVNERGSAPRPLTLPRWEELWRDRSHGDSEIEDDSVGVLNLAHELMRRAFAAGGADIEPFRYQPEVIAFAHEQLRTIPRRGARTFSDSFLRLWRAERLGRLPA